MLTPLINTENVHIIVYTKTYFWENMFISISNFFLYTHAHTHTLCISPDLVR